MTPQQSSRYGGGELELFAAALHWKAYLAAQIRQYLGRDVLEVGAGIGVTTRMLCTPFQATWTALEPDAALAERAKSDFTRRPLPVSCEVRVGGIESLPVEALFSAILYVDVLEHIEDDRAELRQAAAHLRPDGCLVVISPAHNWLFSPFDAGIGHFRRYSRGTLRQAAPTGLTLVRLRYLDAIGLLASAGNRLLLRQSLPTAAQIAIWDRFMVPVSRLVDPLLGFAVGKSILAVWRR